MSLFPAYIEDDLEEYQEEIETPREFGIDYTTGQLTGAVVEGVEAVKVWCYLALRVARYKHFICSWTYGNDLEDLYGKGYSEEHLKSEVSRMIKECLLENQYIESVTIGNVVYIGEKLSVEIEVTTIYGDNTANTYEMAA